MKKTPLLGAPGTVVREGATEKAGVENAGVENTGVENAGVENVSPECMLSCLCASRAKQFMTRVI